MTRLQKTTTGLYLAYFILTLSGLAPVASCVSSSAPSESAGRVTATGKLGVRRFSQTATFLPNGKVLVTGGMQANGVYESSAELFDPQTGKFAATGKMESARS